MNPGFGQSPTGDSFCFFPKSLLCVTLTTDEGIQCWSLTFSFTRNRQCLTSHLCERILRCPRSRLSSQAGTGSPGTVQQISPAILLLPRVGSALLLSWHPWSMPRIKCKFFCKMRSCKTESKVFQIFAKRSVDVLKSLGGYLGQSVGINNANGSGFNRHVGRCVGHTSHFCGSIHWNKKQ